MTASQDKDDFLHSADTALGLFRRLLETGRCPDQFVGHIHELSGRETFPVRKPIAARPKEPCVILVLESPHRDEYVSKPGGPEAPCPANGQTGRNICSHLGRLQAPQYLHSGLILMNAVQFQCSLGAAPEIFRDSVFRGVWSSSGRADFMQRLRDHYVDGDLILNCCTKGKADSDGLFLRDLVDEAIREAIPAAEVKCLPHPASWRGEIGKERPSTGRGRIQSLPR